jgi:hypothetical protein
MAKNASGYSIGVKDVPTILGMSDRGDRDHDIAAWFGVNQGRIAEAKDGKWGSPAPAAQALPPKGPPGIKGRRLRGSVESALKALASNPAQATKILQDAIAVYDKNES